MYINTFFDVIHPVQSVQAAGLAWAIQFQWELTTSHRGLGTVTEEIETIVATGSRRMSIAAVK